MAIRAATNLNVMNAVLKADGYHQQASRKLQRSFRDVYTKRAIYGTWCLQCGDSLIAPDDSTYVCDEKSIRHLWSCSNCGHQFEVSLHPGLRRVA
jgi:transcription elongation factor Elf1